MPAKLYLIPSTITDGGNLATIPSDHARLVAPLRVFFVEEEKSARRFLKRLIPQLELPACEFKPLNEHSKPKEVEGYLNIIRHQDAGIISEAGCPCVADPGADLVLLAHQNDIEVIPLVGPSSILLALMASGLNGQNFAFHGYLPKERADRVKKLKALEHRSFVENESQIFMEAPYRNQNILEDILNSCSLETLLCIASDIAGERQSIKTLPVHKWKKAKVDIQKRPSIFIIHHLK